METTKVLCPSLPDLLRKTVLTFCEGSVKFDKCLEVIGSLHIRSDSERVVTFMVDEQILRLGDHCERLEISHENEQEKDQDGNSEEDKPSLEAFVPPKKSRKILRPMKKNVHMSQACDSSDAESELECMPSDHSTIIGQFANDSSMDNEGEPTMMKYGDEGDMDNVIHTMQYDSQGFERRNTMKGENSHLNITPVLEVSSTKPDYTPPRLESRSSSAQEQSHESMTSPPVLERVHQDMDAQTPATMIDRDDHAPQLSVVSSHSVSSIPPAPVKVESMSDMYSAPRISTSSVGIESQVNPSFPSEHTSVPLPMGSNMVPIVTQAGLMGDLQSQLITQFQSGLFPIGFPMTPPMQALYSANMHKFQYTCNQMQFLKEMLPKENNQSSIKDLLKDKIVMPDGKTSDYDVSEVQPPATTPTATSSSSTWEKLVSCPLCSKKLKSHRMLQLHMNSAHTHKLVYPCKQCDKVFYARSSLHSHAKRAHTPSDQRLKCLFCPRDYAFQSELNRHMELAHGRSQASITNPISTLPQIEEATPPTTSSGQAFPANDRSSDFMQPAYNMSSVLAPEGATSLMSGTGHHSQADNYHDNHQEAPSSGQADTTNSQVAVADLENSDDPQQTPDLYSLKFSCHICGTSLKSKECLALHINAKHTQKHAYPCKICGKVFYAPSSRFCHMKRVHTAVENKFKCSFCWKVFTFHYELRKHMQIMHRTKMLQAGASGLPSETSEYT